MTVNSIPCRRENYGGLRTGPVEYLVVHYTAGDGDTARDNGLYFARERVEASAHYFVDRTGVVASVPENYVAWHCGASVYRHPCCRNANSLGVELCSVMDEDGYRFEAATVDNAAALLAELMERYAIPVERVLRHYDVTGKCCPAPFVTDGAAWRAFLSRLEEPMTQEQFAGLMDQYHRDQGQQPPAAWSEEARAWAEGRGLLVGDSAGMRYQNPVTREELVEILYRVMGGADHGDAQ